MKVAICTPCRSGMVHMHYMLSLLATASSVPKGIEFVFLPLPGQTNVPRARNQLAANAVKAGAKKIWFIDDDISWKPEDFWRITQRPELFIAGLPQKRPGDLRQLMQTPMLMGRFPENKIPTPNANGLVKADDVPTAFLCLDTKVFEVLRENGMAERLHFPQEPDDANEHAYSYFNYSYEADYGVDRMCMQGEDYFFSAQWRKAGKTVWVDPNVRLGHWEGLLGFDLSYQDVVRSMARAASTEQTKEVA